MEILWRWSQNQSVKAITKHTGIAHRTIISWIKKIRQMLNYRFSRLNAFGGPDCEVQIDESLLRGTRKYNVGRLLKGSFKLILFKYGIYFIDFI